MSITGIDIENSEMAPTNLRDLLCYVYFILTSVLSLPLAQDYGKEGQAHDVLMQYFKSKRGT